MSKRILVVAAAASLLSACTGNIGGLLTSVLGQVLQVGKPATGASATPTGSPAPGASNATPASTTTVQADVTLKINGQTAIINPTIKGSFQKVPSGPVTFVTYEIGRPNVANESFATLSIQALDWGSDFTTSKVEVATFNFTQGSTTLQKIFVKGKLSDALTITPNAGKLDLGLTTILDSVYGNPPNVELRIKGLPIS